MNRFKGKSNNRRFDISGIFAVQLVIIVIILFIYATLRISCSSDLNDKENLENALRSNIVHCYALEGFYPPNLDYIEENYGLTYDHSRFIVEYSCFSSNIMPNFVIIELDKDM